MPRNLSHAMQADIGHDELARQSFVVQMKRYLGTAGLEHVRKAYRERVLPQLQEELERPPESAAEVARGMRGQSEYQIWATLYRNGQEQMWQAVMDPVKRADAALSESYRRLSGAKNRLGSLELDPGLDIPSAVRSVDFHLQPGGYALDRRDDDVLAGALYEAGGAAYSRSVGVGVEESKAECLIRHLKTWYPAFSPRDMLDMGCAAGASSVPYTIAFPDASVHAIDVGPGLLRFAHARAEALGTAVHFHQRRVEATGFPDASFDLVVSHNLLHELSDKARLAMMRECHRLLRPGGICVHQDVPLAFSELGPYEQFERSWDAENNGEPFWKSYATGDFAGMMTSAGFDPARVETEFVLQLNGRTRWFTVRASKEC